MDLLTKKKKAAAIAIACFLHQNEEDKTATNDSWGKMGNDRIMEGRNLLQSKGRRPGNSIK